MSGKISVTHQSYGQSCPLSSNERKKGHPCLGQRSADESPLDCWVAEQGALSWEPLLFPPSPVMSKFASVTAIVGLLFVALFAFDASASASSLDDLILNQNLRNIESELNELNRGLERDQSTNNNMQDWLNSKISVPSYALPARSPIPKPRCQTEVDALVDFNKEINLLSDQRWGILPAVMERTDILDYGAKLRIANRAEQLLDQEINRLTSDIIVRLKSGQLCEDTELQSSSNIDNSPAKSILSPTTPNPSNNAYQKQGNTLTLPYDVTTDAWYSNALSVFISNDWISASQPFRPSGVATREEFIKLLVKMNGGILNDPPSQPSFDDVPVRSLGFGWFEEAAKEGWITGQDNCYGKHPCSARPNDPINRAEAAALIIRAFQLTQGDAPTFEDAPASAWYGDSIQTVASRCILQGDDGSARVRPGANMNRAEMIVMLWRVDQAFAYPNCQ